MEGPFPHINSRLCMLLAIIPLSIATIVNEEAEKLEGGMVSIMRRELLSSIQVLGQFFSLLSPPPGTVHLANAAARKAALHLSNIRAGNENMCTSFEDSSSIKAGYFLPIFQYLLSFAYVLSQLSICSHTYGCNCSRKHATPYRGSLYCEEFN
jgi:hypothetical protein